LRVDIESAPRQKDSLHSGKQPGNAVLALVQWNDDRRSAG
jgi:hypothetical protein